MFYRLMLRDERFGEATFTDTPLSKEDAEGLAVSLNAWLKDRLAGSESIDPYGELTKVPLTVRVVSELDFPAE